MLYLTVYHQREVRAALALRKPIRRNILVAGLATVHVFVRKSRLHRFAPLTFLLGRELRFSSYSFDRSKTVLRRYCLKGVEG